ncbi:tRNA pseudouridine synthase A [Heracleum sosnowskyi]|uniref:tRNA pseudouridine synthase A n=1 Tax=Heracleum sosnowskyi TaxID=360622 RepID=A0AAD8IMB0_9APIA|nr:tRNA pseudouridine synthase A [Heracleum sosnowskyi]
MEAPAAAEAAATQQEPNPKKLKMSTTTSDDDTHSSAADKKPRYKRRKIAILFAYCGVGYQGMQKNPGAKTIEGDLEEALYQAGAVPEHDRGVPKRFDWARSARTDKGVSAVGQVVSGRFYIDPPGFIDRFQSNLPDQFRIFGFKRVTGSFNAKKFCDRRRYVYMLPVFALDPIAHRDRESVLASLGSGGELVKCLECSERGRKVFGVMGKRNFDAKGEVNGLMPESGISSNTLSAVKGEDVKMVDLANTDGDNDLASVNGNDVVAEHVNERGNDQNKVIEEKKIDGELNESGFCYGEKEKERFNRILKSYEGTHNYHNFTTRTKADDPSAHRYIISFKADTTVTVDGIEFIKCEIVGQSFMLHQIRKMIGVAVAIMRNCAPESLIDIALQKDINITVPMAPEVGLYLDECFFTSYNQKWKDSHEEVSMKDYEVEAEDFKIKHIYSHIASSEHKDGAVGLWLHSLNYRNYPDLLVATTNGKTTTDVNNVEVEIKTDGTSAETDASTREVKVTTDVKNTEIIAE